MVAVIKTGHSLQRILNYNEQKVKGGIAACLGAVNYPVEASEMTFYQKLELLKRQAELNKNVSRNSVHVSLNFHQTEAKLAPDKLMSIAEDYMQKIGFQKQPYLVYQHHDAGHPHLHIVSVKVRADGRRINMHNIGKLASETARKAIEKQYGLVKAEGDKANVPGKVLDYQKLIVNYGKSQTKQAIQNVLNLVVGGYKYGSLAGLNAALKCFNVTVSRGAENSRVYRHRGLQYQALGPDGKPVGVPLKASLFHQRPGLASLEKIFEQNKQKLFAEKQHVRSQIDAAVNPAISSMSAFSECLKRRHIDVVLHENKQGAIYGITYVDHARKTVFKGSDLGKNYSAGAIQARLTTHQNQHEQQPGNLAVPQAIAQHRFEPTPASDGDVGKVETAALSDLLKPDQESTAVPWQLRKKKRRKKGKRL